MRFKQFEIREPTLIGESPTPDYYRYNFDVVVWGQMTTHAVGVLLI